MKPAAALLCLAAALAPDAAHSQIFADVSTSLGSFTITLDHAAAPKTVANFISLAQGTRPWIHSANGKVMRGKGFYNGITFHRVISGFMSQTGSPNGQGTDGPGYTFRDEIPNGLSHSAAYIVSMANSGPNTNGSQFFITAAATPWLNGKHTVFGLVSAGQSVVDAINTTPTDANDTPVTPVVIQSVAIRRVGAAALAFDELNQGLPVVTIPVVSIQHSPAATLLQFAQPPRSQAYCHLSDDLQSWVGPVERFLDSASPPATSLDLTENIADSPQAFFATSVVTYPEDAVFPQSIAGRTLVASSPNAVFTFAFDPSGGGTWTLANPPLSGQILDFIFSPQPYGCQLLLLLGGINYPFVELQLGADSSNTTHITGRQYGSIAQTEANLGNPSLSIDLTGSFTLTR